MTDSDSTYFPVLNAATPLAFLHIETAEQVELGHYVIVGSLAVILWDIGVSAPDDRRLYKKKKKRFTAAAGVFVAARITAILSLLYSSLVHTAELRFCRVNEYIDIALFILNRSLNTFLYLTRLNAVYQRNPRIVGPFGILWLLVTAAACLSFGAVRGVNIGPTRYCILEIVNEHLLVIPHIVEAVYSCLISAAIMRKVDSVYMELVPVGQRRRFTLDVAGWDYFSERFLRRSQLYFFLTAIIKVAEIIVIPILHFVPVVKPYRFMLFYPDMVVVNVLSSKIYRHTRIDEDGIMTPSTRSTISSIPNFRRPNTSISVAATGTQKSSINVLTGSHVIDDESSLPNLIDTKRQLS